jgi:hypothetical protein
MKCSPYRVPAPGPKQAAGIGPEAPPALVVFVLLALVGTVWIFREPSFGHDERWLSLFSEPPMSVVHGRR